MPTKKTPAENLILVADDLHLRITREEGAARYCVEGLNVPGLCTQARTLEGCVRQARGAARALAADRAAQAREIPAKPPRSRRRTA